MRPLSYRDFSRLPGSRCALAIHLSTHYPQMLRVLHCPTPTGGHSQLLARAERELGLHSTAVIWRQDAFAFPADEVLCPPTAHPLQRERMRFYSPETCATRLRYCPFQLWSDTHATICADAGADAFAISTLVVLVYGPYAWLLEMRDLLAEAGRERDCRYVSGDDARQGDFCQTHFAISPMLDLEPGYYTPASDARKRWRIAQFATMLTASMRSIPICCTFCLRKLSFCLIRMSICAPGGLHLRRSLRPNG